MTNEIKLPISSSFRSATETCQLADKFHVRKLYSCTHRFAEEMLCLFKPAEVGSGDFVKGSTADISKPFFSLQRELPILDTALQSHLSITFYCSMYPAISLIWLVRGPIAAGWLRFYYTVMWFVQIPAAADTLVLMTHSMVAYMTCSLMQAPPLTLTCTPFHKCGCRLYT